jgi:hypothetical protein
MRPVLQIQQFNLTIPASVQQIDAIHYVMSLYLLAFMAG